MQTRKTGQAVWMFRLIRVLHGYKCHIAGFPTVWLIYFGADPHDVMNCFEAIIYKNDLSFLD